MLGGIIAIAVAVWFYRTAESIGNPTPLQWGVIGVAVYYGVLAAWTVFANTPFMEEFHHTSKTIGIIVHYLGIVFGLALAWWVRRRWLLKA